MVRGASSHAPEPGKYVPGNPEYRQEPLGGAEGTRTPDPLDANEVRYQLRYSPLRCAQGSKRRGASPNQVRGSGHCMDRNAAARIVHRLARRAAT